MSMIPSQMSNNPSQPVAIREFNLSDGRPVAIKRKHISSINEMASGNCYVRMDDGTFFVIDADYDDVVGWWMQ